MNEIILSALALAGASLPLAAQPLNDWPAVHSRVAPDPQLEARIARIVRTMTLEQKVGQMTQPEIKSATPDDVRRYYLGSVLNGGGSWPNGNKHASAADWVALAQRYYDASMATGMETPVPVVWGIDAIHGNSNVFGATLFPHNIGLGAAHDPQLVGRIGAAVGKAVRATGINWVFAPTLAVVRDDRWGRTYESFSEDAQLVRSYAGPYVQGLQGDLRGPGTVIATAKHFIGDGGTDQGKDRGINLSSRAQMINLHGQGYYGALAAGAQTVMASFNSWNDVGAGVDYGKMHGSRAMLTDALKTKMGFDGFVVSDWNGIAEVPGCRVDSCAQAINAGIDMVMVPDDWKAFIANTIAQVRSGAIPMTRIDDAVTRILRVKLRAGLFGHPPRAGAYAGHASALRARALARAAVRASLVLLKNETPALPLRPGTKLLVVGKSADSLAHQTGGWSLTWQGTDNSNADFPQADTVLAGLRSALGAANVTYSADAAGVDVRRFDAVIAVLGERPYAEGEGDIGPGATLRHTSRYPEDLAVLQAVAGHGKPVITVFESGRPLYVNDLLNLSDAFIAAWLPGTEGKGVADLLVRGKARFDFRGTLSFSWPKSACQTPLNAGDAAYAPLFPLGYGLRMTERSRLGQLDTDYPAAGCGVSDTYPIFTAADRASYPLALRSGAQALALGADLNAVFEVPGLRVRTTQINTQQDAKQGAWSGRATIEAHGARPLALPASFRAGALRFATIVTQAPAGKVTLAMQCGTQCGASLNATAMFTRLAGQGRQVVEIPLACFTNAGADLTRVDTPFSITSDAALTASFANIDIVATPSAHAAHCEDLQ